MSVANTVIDLSKLPAPEVVEQPSHEALAHELMTQFVADMQAINPAYTTPLTSDPIHVLVWRFAYRELLLRQRIDEATKAVMLAYAVGSDLDQIAARYGVVRQADETDARFRERAQLALEGLSVAGPVNAYRFHVLSASPLVKGVSVVSPEPGEVEVTVLSREGNGEPDQALIDTVTAAINAEDVRPLTDMVTVKAAEVIEYEITATVDVYPGPDPEIAANAAREAAAAYVLDQHNLGRDITLSGVYAAIHQPGVQNVRLDSPNADIAVGDHQAAFCTRVNIELGVIHE